MQAHNTQGGVARNTQAAAGNKPQVGAIHKLYGAFGGQHTAGQKFRLKKTWQQTPHKKQVILMTFS